MLSKQLLLNSPKLQQFNTQSKQNVLYRNLIILLSNETEPIIATFNNNKDQSISNLANTKKNRYRNEGTHEKLKSRENYCLLFICTNKWLSQKLKQVMIWQKEVKIVEDYHPKTTATKVLPVLGLKQEEWGSVGCLWAIWKKEKIVNIKTDIYFTVTHG